jgi:predicted N-acetyltransferase YhbS
MTTLLQPVSQARAADHLDIESLLDAAFGTDRQMRTTYRLRDHNIRADDLSLVVRQSDGHLCGSIEFWPIDLVDANSGVASRALLLGPIAVDEACRGKGVGSTLMRQGIAAAQAAGHATIVLVGDPEFYGRFGFSNAVTQNWSLPGPVEQRRLLVLSDTTALPDVAHIRPSFALEYPHSGSDTDTQ